MSKIKQMLPVSICCIAAIILLASCKKQEVEVVIESSIVNSFFESKEKAKAILGVEDSDIQSSNDLLEEYIENLTWCGKNLPTTIHFYDDEPVMLFATTEMQNTDNCIEKINDDLILFEEQFKAKSIDIVGEDGDNGKIIDYDREIISGELKRIMDSFGLVRFKFSVPGKEDSKIVVEYTCKRWPTNPEQIIIEYSIRNYRPILK